MYEEVIRKGNKMDCLNDVIITVDEERYERLQKNYLELGNAINDEIDTYLSIVDSLADVAVPSGNTHANLVSFRDSIYSLKKEEIPLTQILSGFACDFLRDIQETDRALLS